MASGPATVSEAIKVDPQEGDQTTYTVESFVGYPVPPSGAQDIQKSLEDGKYTLRYTIKGTGTSADPVYTISGSVSQEPLATHALFRTGSLQIADTEWKKWKQWESDPSNSELAGWKPDGESASAGMKKYYAYRNRGVEDYLLGSVTMRVSEENQGQPNLANLGRLSKPSHAPALPDSRDWLLVGIDAERVGTGRWKVTREYRASAAGGWDKEIYSKA